MWHSASVSKKISAGTTTSNHIWRDAPGARLRPAETPTAVTIGNFDGVHRGHQYVLRQAVDVGAEHGLPVTAVTFDPHPLVVLAPDHAPARLTTLERRIELLRANGADVVYVLAFSDDMAGWSPQEFINRVLIDQLRARQVIVGQNFRFGHKAAGDIDVLKDQGAAHGFQVTGLELTGASAVNSPAPYSSTLVRRLVGGGDLPAASEVLGRPHEVCGSITRGDGRGRELGFPTANMPVDESYAVPPDGVYTGWLVTPDGRRLPNAISVGTNPTFRGSERRIESYAIDHSDLDLYDSYVRVEFVEQLRPMQSFASVDALVAQMAEDVDTARTALRSQVEAD